MPPMLVSPNPSNQTVGQRSSPRWITLERIFGLISILGLMGLSYVAGAAVLYFRLPTSAFLLKAFIGGVASNERGKPFVSSTLASAKPLPAGLILDTPGKTDDGFTLLTTSQFSRAVLLDMKGNPVYKWELPFDAVWPQAPHVKNQLDNDLIQWFTAHLYPNGDILAIYQAENDTPYGYGLVKLDKDSKVVWKYANNAHHTIDVGDDGKIYTVVHHNLTERPRGLDQIPSPYTDDFLSILSPEGQELTSFSITQAFLSSPYALAFKDALLERLEVADLDPFGGLLTTPGTQQTPRPEISLGSSHDKAKIGMPIDLLRQDGMIIKQKGDLLHVNSAKVLTKKLKETGKFPLFEAGQVMVSVRTLDLIAVIDPEKKQVVWASTGIWRNQHDPEFLPNGHILIYDNYGSRLGTRVLEVDPVTQAITWIYSSDNTEPFLAVHRGMKERLKNGNTLILDPEPGRLLEVTPDKKIVWQFNPVAEQNANGDKDAPPTTHALTSAHRYRAQDLPFLQKIARPRP